MRRSRGLGFVWDGGENVSVCSRPVARIRNIGRNPKVTLNFGADEEGGDIVILIAEVDESGLRAVEDTRLRPSAPPSSSVSG